ncbi:MAG: cell division protein FtsA [Candidatus Pacebacteria bacterium]|nr:cell division protein FtsA [Candidatus Paceibacterota bacterium]
MKPILALDLGNQNIRLILAQQTDDLKTKILAALERPSDGLSRGSIVDYGAFVGSLFETFDDLKKMGHSPKSAIVSVASPHTTFKIAKVVGGVARSDGEITKHDIEQLNEKFRETINESGNKKILHIIPRQFNVDDLSNIKDPLGMHGYRLEMEAALVEVFIPHLKTLEKAFAETKKDVIQEVFSPLASSLACLTKKQMNVGTIMIDIGAENTNFIIVEEDQILDAGILNFGADNITHDIAICLKIPLEVAEKIKLTYGYALSDEVNRKENIDLSKMNKEITSEINKRYLAEIIEARLEEIFDPINDAIKRNNCYAKLAGGAVLVGGGAKLPGLADFAKKYLKLPAKIGYPINLSGIATNEKFLDLIDDPAFVLAAGLILWEMNNKVENRKINFISNTPFLQKLKKIFKIFLP